VFLLVEQENQVNEINNKTMWGILFFGSMLVDNFK